MAGGLLAVVLVLTLGCGARSSAPPIAPHDAPPPSTLATPATTDGEVRGGATNPMPPVVLVGRKRDRDQVAADAEAGLLRLIAEHPTGPQVAEARLRLGTLYLDQAEAALDGVAPAGAPALARKAMAQLEAARADVPTYVRLDLVLYQLGHAARFAGDAAVARDAFRQLAALAASPLASEAWLRLGELAFDDGDLAVAIDAYGRARRDPQFAAVATYKLGWSHWRRGDLGAAAVMFQAVLDLAATSPDATGFAAEARQYLALALVEDDQDGDGAPDPDPVVRVLSHLGDGAATDRRATAETAADALVDQASYASAIIVYDRLLITVVAADDRTRLSGKLARTRALRR